MKWSRSFLPMQDLHHEAQKNADSSFNPTRLLMSRAALIHPSTAENSTYSVFALRSLRKLQQIIRSEMDRAGAQEFLIPSAATEPLRQESAGDYVLQNLKDAADLPIQLYQIQVQPSAGAATRESLVLDSYAFEAVATAATGSGEKVHAALSNISKRIGIAGLQLKQSSPLKADRIEESQISTPSADGAPISLVMRHQKVSVTQLLSDIIERSHDADGIIWPVSIAPFTVQVIALDAESVEVLQSAEIIYRDLQMHGLDVFFDDRVVRAEIKVKDADRIGFPIQIHISARGLENDEVEVITRHDKKMQKVSVDLCVERVGEVANELARI